MALTKPRAGSLAFGVKPGWSLELVIMMALGLLGMDFWVIGRVGQARDGHLALSSLASSMLGQRASRGRTACAVRERADDPEAAKKLTREIMATESASTLLALLEEHADRPTFNHFHMSATFTKLVRLREGKQLPPAHLHSRAWPKLSARLRVLIQENKLPHREAANVYWALAKASQDVGKQMPVALPDVVRHVADQADVMNAQDIANSFWAAVTLQDAALVAAIVRRVPAVVSSMKPQELVNSLWAAASLHHTVPVVQSVVPILAACIQKKVGGMNAQNLSNCLWAAAKLHEAAPEVLQVAPTLAKRVSLKAIEMIPQELSNSLWATAKLRKAEPGVLQAVSPLTECIKRQAHKFNPRDLAQCAWAAANLQKTAPEILEAVPALVAQFPPDLSIMATEQLQISWLAADQLGDDDLAVMLKAEISRRSH